MFGTQVTKGPLRYRERAVRLGPQEQLVGILTLPVDPSKPLAVVALNAGVLHRVGPHRLHVRLLRQLAGLGFPGLRLDLAGIGDSLAVGGTQSFRESAVGDARASMDDLVAIVGVRRFVLFGLCSGADNALATALVDDRVAGIILLDPPSYPTRRARARGVAQRIAALSAGGALRWVLRMARRPLASIRQLASAGHAPRAEGREPPPLATYRDQLHQLLERGVRILTIYSGGLGERYNHVDQLFEYAPELRGRVDHLYFPDANHTFTERAAQATLVETVVAWVGRTFTSAG